MKTLFNTAAEKKQAINKLLTLCARVETGAYLVNTLSAQKTAVTFDNRIAPTEAWLDEEDNIIRLSGRNYKKRLPEALLHEATHIEQNTHIPYQIADALRPEDKIVFLRLLEGDAYTLSNLAVHEINRLEGNKPYECYETVEDRPATMSVTEHYVAEAFWRFQSSYIASLYDLDALDDARRLRKQKPDISQTLQLRDMYNDIAVLAATRGTATPVPYAGTQNIEEVVDRLRMQVEADILRKARRI